MLELKHQDIKPIRNEIKKGVKSLLVTLPTGGGKTHIATKIIKSAVDKGSACMFVVERNVLVEQTIKAFSEFDIGVIQGKHELSDDTKPVLIASAQTLVNRELPTHIKILIIDEAHHATINNKYYKDLIAFYKAKGVKIIGFTATPAAQNPLLFDKCIVLSTVQNLIKLNKTNGFGLVDVDLKTFPAWDVKMNKKTNDYDNNEQSEWVKNGGICGDVIKNYQLFASERPTIAFLPLVKDSEFFCELFNKNGIKAAHIDAKTKDKERDNYYQLLEKGELKVLFSVGTLVEGFDLPGISCVMLLQKTAILANYIQKCGRGLRSAKNKKDCVILDFAGNYHDHGLPTVDRDWIHLFNETQLIDKKKAINKVANDEKVLLDWRNEYLGIENMDPNMILQSIEQNPIKHSTLINNIKNTFKFYLKQAKSMGYKQGSAWYRTVNAFGGNKKIVNAALKIKV